MSAALIGPFLSAAAPVACGRSACARVEEDGCGRSAAGVEEQATNVLVT
jgi:hypothetical protein